MVFKAREVDVCSISSSNGSAPLIMDQEVGEWVEGRVVSRGKFGVVRRGLLKDGRCIAIKKVQTAGMTEMQLDDLGNEITLMKSLEHPCIVKYLGFEYTCSTLSILMEFVHGGSLRKFISVYGSLTESLTAIYTGKILEGLSYLHERNVAHHDIKSNNILLGGAAGRGITDAAPIVKLADFGISRYLGVQENVVSGLRGTPQWMAPEMVRGEKHFEDRFKADVWSVGCTVIEMLTGHTPWQDIANPITVMYFIARGFAPPVDCQIGDEARSFIDACCHGEPNLRPTSSSLTKHPFLSNTHTAVEEDAGSSISEVTQTETLKPVSNNDVQQHIGHEYYGAKTGLQQHMRNNRRSRNKELCSGGNMPSSGNSSTSTTSRKTKLESLDLSNYSFDLKGSMSDITASITSACTTNPVESRSPNVGYGISSSLSTSPIFGALREKEEKSSSSFDGSRKNASKYQIHTEELPSCGHIQQERHAQPVLTSVISTPPRYESRCVPTHRKAPSSLVSNLRLHGARIPYTRTGINPHLAESRSLSSKSQPILIAKEQNTCIDQLSSSTSLPCSTDITPNRRVRRPMMSQSHKSKRQIGAASNDVVMSQRLSPQPPLAVPILRQPQHKSKHQIESATDNDVFALNAPRLRVTKSTVLSASDIPSLAVQAIGLSGKQNGRGGRHPSPIRSVESINNYKPELSPYDVSGEASAMEGNGTSFFQINSVEGLPRSLLSSPDLKCNVFCFEPGLRKAKQSVVTPHRRSTSFTEVFATDPCSVETSTASFVAITSAGVQRSSTKLATSLKYYTGKSKADFLQDGLSMSTPGSPSSGMVIPTRTWKTSKYNSTSLGCAAQKSGVGTFAPSSGSLIEQSEPHKRIG